MIIGSNIQRHDTLPSTNTYAEELLKNDSPLEGTVIVAGYQTAGKGQGSNRWESKAQSNLLISIILYPQTIIPDEQVYITMMVSLCLCDFFDDYDINCRIKQPNDIYHDNDKMAGILIKNTIIDGRMNSSVVGIGVNINQTDFPDWIPNPTSLKKVTGKEYNLDSCLQQLLKKLDIRYKQLLYGDHYMLSREYNNRLLNVIQG